MSDPTAPADEPAQEPAEGPAPVVDTATRVRAMLAPFDDVVVGEDGTCSLSYGSANVMVDIGVFDEDQDVVHVRARCVSGATRSPELYRWAATTRPELGAFRVVDEEDGSATIELSRTLVAEFLNPAELRLSIVALALTADRHDDELAARFGGSVHDAAGNLVDPASS
jgi:hypothetical protein